MNHPTNTAEVRAHDRVMRYERSGTGRPLLVLGADQPGDLWPELAGLLSRHFRVLVPDIPPGVDGAQWLECFFDGLGVDDVAIVAGGRHCDAALELALGTGERVSSVVLVPSGGGESEPSLPRDAASDGRRPRLYVVPRGVSAEEGAERIGGFLQTADPSLRSG